MPESIQQSLGALFQPIAILWMALLASVVYQVCRGRIVAALYPALLAAFIQIIGGTEIPARLLADLERPYDPIGRGWPTKADAVIMLGGTHDYSSRSPLHFGVGEAADRILAAIDLSRTTGASALILGGNYYELNGVRHPDSDMLLDWIKAWRIPSAPIFPLGMSANTREEAERAARLCQERKWTRLVLVSSGYHLKRSEALFKKLGVPVMPVGAEFLGLDSLGGRERWHVVPRNRGFELLGYWVHEQVGMIYYRLRGWI